MGKKYVYSFHEGNKDMRNLLGGKGANLAEMTNIGINVPTGFTVTTEACNRYYEEDGKLWDGLLAEIREHLAEVEKDLGKSFNDAQNPLLFSVRSGAVFSMPGMMDTILNLGLNDTAVEGLAASTGNARFAYDAYRRFIQMFSDVAMDVPKALFENELTKAKADKGVELDTDLDADDLKALVAKYKAIYKAEMGEDFPQDPFEQLKLSIAAVFRSWNNPRAIYYRKLNDIPDNLGTAVNVQSMVFGNMGDTSGTGVAFSRNPATGENHIFGEYLMNAQGEDVVAGVRTPEPLDHLGEVMPDMYKEFCDTAHRLEKHYRDMQDIEFTIENGRLFILQTRSGKRTTQAAINIAVDMVEEGMIAKDEAVMRIEPKSLDQILHPTFNKESAEAAELLATGLAASPGAAYGTLAFTAQDAKARAAEGENILLVREETSPEDLEGMVTAKGILTARGGMTSHAAVVARGMGKCCVAGASALFIDEVSKTVKIGDKVFGENDVFSIDGSTGKIYLGQITTEEPQLSGKFGIFMEWVNEIKRMAVRANADSPRDARQALEFGAEGIGLCRTEHMFFAEDRLPFMREMIVSKTTEQRKTALAKILPVQENDFYEMYKILQGLPMTVRLLDPPLHEFLPTADADIQALADEMGLSFDDLRKTTLELAEINPMLGHRGLRLAVTYPEIYRMQARAIIQAAMRVTEEGVEMVPEIMIPLVGDKTELKTVKDQIVEEIEMVFEEKGKEIEYEIGTMLEIPRAALLADEIAEEAAFFSFGTNDMTQMTYGFSRDDAGKFLTEYIERGIFEKDPFEVLDQRGVGKLVEMACKLGRKTKPNLGLGICGEHGGEPSTVMYLDTLGLDYVSCSPFRVPIARLAAAQGAIADGNYHRDV